MIATIAGILLFLWMMLSINKPPSRSPIDDQVYDIARGKVSFREVVEKKPAIPTTSPTSIATKIVSTIEEPEIVYKNIAKTSNPLHWFECPHPDLPKPSVPEQMIIDELNRYKVKWYREVSFYGLQVNSYSYPRYDIFIPSHMLILEYDGEAYHNTPHTKAMDKLKNKFCKDNGLRIIRWNKSHYHHIPTRVKSLMAQYNISPK